MLPWPVHPLLTGSAFDREHRPQQLRVEPRAESTSRFDATLRSVSCFPFMVFFGLNLVLIFDFLYLGLCVTPQAEEERGEGGKEEKIRGHE